MTDREKAAAILDKLEEYDSKTVINTLNEYLSDEDLAELYDRFKEEGEI